MRNKILLSVRPPQWLCYGGRVGTFAVLLAIAGCTTGQDNSGRAIKMQRSSGKMNREVDAAWYAVCKDASADTHPTEWKGPLRTDKERAMRDANDHNKQFPDHEAIIAHH